jgi:hypothetical protein
MRDQALDRYAPKELLLEAAELMEAMLVCEHRAVVANVRLGKWMNSALDDPDVCDEMKADIREWFSAGHPPSALIDSVVMPSGGYDMRLALPIVERLRNYHTTSRLRNIHPLICDEAAEAIQTLHSALEAVRVAIDKLTWPEKPRDRITLYAETLVGLRITVNNALAKALGL